MSAMAQPAVAANCKVVTAPGIAKVLLGEVAEGLSKLRQKPVLVGFLANDDPAAKMYADWSAKTCTENGFIFDLRTVNKEDIEEAILAANVDPSVNGIIVYYPIFPRTSRQDQYIQQLVALNKDVEGLSHKYIFNMYQNIRFLDSPTNKQKSILPCTPLAVVKVLEYLQIYNSILPYGNRLFGKTITIINRSEVVGRPLAALLANDGAKVYSVDIDGVQVFTRGKGIKKDKHEVHEQKGWTREDCLPLSDVVISGVPAKGFKVETELIRDGAVCICFSSEKNFDKDAVKEHASIYVPAIGKVTIAVLLRNLLRLVQNQRHAGELNANIIAEKSPSYTPANGTQTPSTEEPESKISQPAETIVASIPNSSRELPRQSERDPIPDRRTDTHASQEWLGQEFPRKTLARIEHLEEALAAKERALAAMEDYLAAKEKALTAKEEVLAAKEGYLAAMEDYLAAKEKALTAKEEETQAPLPQATSTPASTSTILQAPTQAAPVQAPAQAAPIQVPAQAAPVQTPVQAAPVQALPQIPLQAPLPSSLQPLIQPPFSVLDFDSVATATISIFAPSPSLTKIDEEDEDEDEEDLPSASSHSA